MNLFIRDPDWLARFADSQRPAHSKALLKMAGFPDGRCPPEGFSDRVIDGITIFALPQRREFRIRVRAVCPACKGFFAASRLKQHSKVHK